LAETRQRLEVPSRPYRKKRVFSREQPPAACRTAIERRLAGRESLVLEAGSHEESIRIAANDFVRIAGAQPADIRED